MTKIKNKKKNGLELYKAKRQLYLELNLAELPLCLVDEGSTEKTSVREWETVDGYKRKIALSCLVDTTLPTISDFDVLLALLRIYAKNHDRIMFNSDSDKYEFKYVIVHFNYREVLNELGLTVCGENIKKVKNAIIRFWSTKVLSSIETSPIYNYKEKAYVDTTKMTRKKGREIIDGIGIIEDMRLYDTIDSEDRKISNEAIKEYNFIVLDRFFFESMCNGYLRIIDFDFYLKLKSGIAKRIYLLMEKFGGNNKNLFWFFSYKNLKGRIPLKNPNAPDKEINRQIRNGALELVKLEYAKDLVKDIKRKGFYLTYQDGMNLETIRSIQDNEYCGFDKYLTMEEVIDKLHNGYGIEISELTILKDLDFDYIKAYMRYLDVRLKYGKVVHELKKYVMSGFKNKYNIEKKYWDNKNTCQQLTIEDILS